MHGSYNRRKAKELSERCKRMARIRWDREHARRHAERAEMERHLEEIEILNYPRKPRDAVGCLQYHCFSTGKVTRWIVEIGNRADSRVFRSPDGRRSESAGWAWLLRGVRMVILGNYLGLKGKRRFPA